MGKGRPKGGYYLKSKKRVPSVTTITGKYQDPGGLMHWSAELGLKGKDYRLERDFAAGIGTLAHDMIEASVTGGEPEEEVRAFLQKMKDGEIWPADKIKEMRPDKMVERARTSFQAFRLWLESTSIKIIHTETPLVSEEFEFGGTLDGVGETPHGGYDLLDWKTGNSVHVSMLRQIAAYGVLVRENGLVSRPLERFHIVRVGKDYGDFHHHNWPREAMEPAWESFKKMREIYELDKRLKGISGT